MRLLVSVRNADEAREALAGGADVVDAKDPFLGALGAVEPAVFGQVMQATGGARPVSAALGDARDPRQTERDARVAAAQGASFVKIGFAGVADKTRAGVLLAAAVRGARAGSAACGVVAVAYADAGRVGAVSPDAVLAVAADQGANGVLMDTVQKSGRALFQQVSDEALADWVREAHRWQLTVALAGQLGPKDFARALTLGADIVGVRGAACRGERTGPVTRDRVRALALSLHDDHSVASMAGRRSGSMIETAS